MHVPIGSSMGTNNRYMQWARIWREQVSLGEKWSIAERKSLIMQVSDERPCLLNELLKIMYRKSRRALSEYDACHRQRLRTHVPRDVDAAEHVLSCHSHVSPAWNKAARAGSSAPAPAVAVQWDGWGGLGSESPGRPQRRRARVWTRSRSSICCL